MDQIQLLPYYGSDKTDDYFADYYDAYDDINDQNLYYRQDIDEDKYDDYSFWSDMPFPQLCSQCILPALWSTSNLLGTTLILCVFFRLFIIMYNKVQIVPEVILHLVCALCGVLPLILFHEDEDLQQLLLQIVLFPVFCYIVSLICILCFKRHFSIIFSVIILLILIYCECFSDDQKWQKNKSAHMLMSMKAMAVLFDLRANDLLAFPSVAQYTGYMLCAGTFYLGPFLTFQEYCNAFLFPVCWNKKKLCSVIWKIVISLVYFVLSICVVDWLFSQNVYFNKNSDTIISLLITMYKRAFEFRTGHYFIAYASTVFALVCGYHSEYYNEILVSNPITIEWPRSLLHVVVHWNAPMHYWLKKYVFEEVLKYGNQNQKHRNKILAVGTTYLISSILHGLEKRLSAVLLSLAAYTYVEHHFRSKLALRFPRSLSCSKKDYHSVKYLSSSNKSTWFLWCINIMFTFLNIIHLAYLGSVMDMSGNMNTNQDSFALWRQTSFFSHIIMLFMFFISIIL